jgi:hypothetical protein
VSDVPARVSIPLDWKIAQAELTKVVQAHARKINEKPVASTGTATASFTATNKPGGNNKTSPDVWLEFVDSEGKTYYVPAFLP